MSVTLRILLCFLNKKKVILSRITNPNQLPKQSDAEMPSKQGMVLNLDQWFYSNKNIGYFYYVLKKSVFTMMVSKFQSTLNVMCSRVFKLRGTMRVFQSHVFVLHIWKLDPCSFKDPVISTRTESLSLSTSYSFLLSHRNICYDCHNEFPWSSLIRKCYSKENIIYCCWNTAMTLKSQLRCSWGAVRQPRASRVILF